MAFGSKNRVRVQAGVDGVGQSVSELQKFRNAFDALAGSKGAQSILQGVGMGAGISAWNALSSGIATAIDVATDSIEKASDLREAMTLSQQVFEENTGAVEDWARATDDAFSTREALNFASQFGTAFKNVGMSLDETVEKSKALTTLAGDLGSAFNASSEEAATALRSGLLGESEPLRRFGVFLDEAKVKAKAAAMGMQPLNGALTDGQKVAARYALILEQTADSQGMFGRDTESLADQQKLLTAAFEDLQAQIGEELLPVAVELVKWANDDLVPALQDAVTWIRENEDAFKVLGDAIGIAVDGPIKHAMNAYEDAQEDAQEKALEAALETADAWDTGSERVGAALDAVKGPAASLEQNLTALADEASDTAGTFDKLRDAVRGAMDQMIEDQYDPEQLKLELQSTKLELQGNIEKLAELEAIANPTREQRKDIVDTKLAISRGREEVEKLTGRINTLDAQSVARITAHFSRLGQKIDWTSDQATDLLTLLRDIDRAESQVNWRGANRPGGTGGKATGGYVPPGWSGWVGEEGPELMRVVAGGAIVTNRDQSASLRGGSGSGAPVVIQLALDGRTIAEIVDQHLYYEAARAPQSSYAG